MKLCISYFLPLIVDVKNEKTSNRCINFEFYTILFSKRKKGEESSVRQSCCICSTAWRFLFIWSYVMNYLSIFKISF